MSSKPADKQLYEKVKRRADRVFERHGLYKSAWIQREYKRLGGTYEGKKPTAKTGLRRWLEGERWIEVEPYLRSGAEVPCGGSNRKGKACRPLRRATKHTPVTLPELLKLHDRKLLLKLARQKQRDMDGRVDWRAGTFTPSREAK